jgi:hypothetical protein
VGFDCVGQDATQRVEDMRAHSDIYGPDAHKVLQQINDRIWEELKLQTEIGPLDRRFRQKVSRLVLQKSKDDPLDCEGIYLAVMQSLGAGPPH